MGIKKITGLRYVFILLTQMTRFQCSDVFKEAQIEYMKNLCMNIFCFQLRLNSQQFLTFLQKEQKKSALTIRTLKGTLSFWCYVLFCSLNTATVQPIPKAQKTVVCMFPHLNGQLEEA